MLKILRAISLVRTFHPVTTRNAQGISLNAHSFVRHSSSKELRPTLTHQDDREDLLMQNLRSSRDVEHVLYTVSQHHSIMSNSHLTHALQSIQTLHKSRCSSLKKSEILQSEDFEILCEKLVKKGRTLDLQSTLNCFKNLVYLGVPTSSTVMQAVLHLIKHQVNDLNLKDIVFTTFLCGKLEQDPLVDALKIALPLVFESQYKLKIDKDDLRELASMLRFAENPNISENCFNEIMNHIATHPGNLYGRDAMQVATAISNVGHFIDAQVPLAHRALSGVVSSIYSFQFPQIKFLLGMLVKNLHRYRQFYNEQFFDACVSYAIEKNLSFADNVWILRRLSTAAHTSIPLMDHIAQQIESNPRHLENCHLMTIFALPAGYANANYKPKNWDQIRDLLVENFKRIPSETRNIPWPKFALDLASLHCFDADILKQIFSPSFLETFLSRDNNLLDHIQLLTLYQAVRVLYPEYEGPFPSEEIIQKAKDLNGEHVKEYPLRAALEQAMGGAFYVKTRLYSKLGHFIDHAVAVRKGGFAVAINSANSEPTGNREYIEDLKVPEDSQIVLVLAMPPGSLSQNGRRLRGSLLLRSRTLEASGYAVVTVSTECWQQMPDYEKIPFLMQQIKLKSSEYFEQVTAF